MNCIFCGLPAGAGNICLASSNVSYPSNLGTKEHCCTFSSFSNAVDKDTQLMSTHPLYNARTVVQLQQLCVVTHSSRLLYPVLVERLLDLNLITSVDLVSNEHYYFIGTEGLKLLWQIELIPNAIHVN